MSTEAQTQVEKILSNVGVTFTATYAGEKPFDDPKHPMDAWNCVFSSPLPPNGRRLVQFDFHAGLGHREAPARLPFGHPNRNDGPRTVARALQELAKPKAPHPADVLQCLILDASAIGQSFESWCGDIGYDSDSRKALGIYEACQLNADKLHRFFSPEALQALRDALQDY